MSRQMVLLLALALTTVVNVQGTESEIKARAKQYEEAFNKKSPQDLAQLWAEEGVYTNPRTGQVVEGREAIQRQFETNFKYNPKAQIHISIDSVKFPSTTEAVASGKATLTATQSTDVADFKAVFEKENGQWQLARFSEIAFEQPHSSYEHLKDLEWLVGSWNDSDDDTHISITAKWDQYKNFITQKFQVSALDTPQLEVQQIIAWDPVKKELRSWIFDSNGGFGEGVWSKKGDIWTVNTVFTLADGRRASATNIYSNIQPDAYTWQSTGRQVDNDLLPNIPPVTVSKEKAS